MKKVMFWQISDTIVNTFDASQTFEIISIEPHIGGNWIIMRHLHSGEFINGYELGLQGMGYVGYRTNKTPIFA
jgi:hypothetical protein